MKPTFLGSHEEAPCMDTNFGTRLKKIKMDSDAGRGCAVRSPHYRTCGEKNLKFFSLSLFVPL
jgi:hypothetical protein